MPSTPTSIKEKLHERIECINDEKVLEPFYTILYNYKNEAEDYELTDVQLKELEKREADYLSGKDKAVTIVDFIKITNEKYWFKLETE